MIGPRGLHVCNLRRGKKTTATGTLQPPDDSQPATRQQSTEYMSKTAETLYNESRTQSPAGTQIEKDNDNRQN